MIFESNDAVGNGAGYYGFGGAYLANTGFWSLTERAGAGPGGQDALEWRAIDGGTITDNQFTFGHVKSGLTPPAQGSTVYIRTRIKVLSPITWTDQPSGGPWGNKFIILGSGGSSSSGRMIWNINRYSDSTPGTWNIVAEKNIEGNGGPNGDTRITVSELLPDVWYNIQWKIQFPSTSTAQDGRAYLYINGDNASEATPTASTGTWIHDCSTMGGELTRGTYADAADATSNIVWQTADFEYDTAFDNTWGNGGSGGGGGGSSVTFGMGIGEF